MNGVMLVEVSLGLLQGLLGALKANNGAVEQVANVQAAIDNLLKVQGTPETYGQLESFRVNVRW